VVLLRQLPSQQQALHHQLRGDGRLTHTGLATQFAERRNYDRAPTATQRGCTRSGLYHSDSSATLAIKFIPHGSLPGCFRQNALIGTDRPIWVNYQPEVL
jgi:hypothetical protein